MTPDKLTKQYGLLTPEERFRLILAASGRGDDSERDCLVRSHKPVSFSQADYTPYAQAMHEVSILIFIELLEMAASLQEAWYRADVVGCEAELFRSANGDEGDDDDQEIGSDQDSVKTPAEPTHDNASRLPRGERLLNLALAHGYMFQVRLDGWRIFCQHWHLSPFQTWIGLPGFERLQAALSITQVACFAEEGFLRWWEQTRPPEASPDSLPQTAESIAAGIEKLYRERVQWWGA